MLPDTTSPVQHYLNRADEETVNQATQWTLIHITDTFTTHTVILHSFPKLQRLRN